MTTIDGVMLSALVSLLTIIFHMRALFERILSPTSFNSVKARCPENRSIHNKAKPATRYGKRMTATALQRQAPVRQAKLLHRNSASNPTGLQVPRLANFDAGAAVSMLRGKYATRVKSI